MSITIDIDTGGTFTDAFVVRDGTAHTVKVLTTPHDLAVCFRDVLAGAAAVLGVTVAEMLRETVAVRYATTVGTNAVIQRRGPRLGLLAAAGAGSPPPGTHGVGLFVDAEMVRALPSDAAENGRLGGTSNSGAGEAGPAPEHVGRAATDLLAPARELLDEGARGLVAALGGDAAGQAAEHRVREVFDASFPHTCLDTVPLLLAGDVTSDPDEARRTATALFNAYVHPDVADYLYRAEDHLRDHGYRRPLLIVHNDGGCARVAKTIAGKTYNSGPTAGLLGAGAVARLYGARTLVSLDMGGTSLDVAIVHAGQLPMLEHGVVEGVEISFPLPDLVALGAGGGSIAWLDGDELCVGPQSAGARPGPACFGFGGEQPTVTDADVVLGILRPEAFLGGSMPIDVELARGAVRRIAEPLGCEVEEAAAGVRETVHTQMGARLAAELERRSVDPSSVTVLAFGGNGATHCAGIAAAAGISEVIALSFSPVFSAYGASTADVRHRYELRAGEEQLPMLRERALRDMRGEGFHEPEVTLATETFERDGESWIALTASRALPHVELASAATSAATASADGGAVKEILWPGAGVLSTQVRRREQLSPGAALAGPALVDSPTTTCAVPPGWTLQIDEHGAERLRQEGRSTR